MLTFEEAKRIGKNACIEKIGREFYEKYKAFSVTAYGDFNDEGVTFCYIGVDTQPPKENDSKTLILSDREKKNAFPFSASCNVHLSNGAVEFLECKLPEGWEE